MSEIDPDKSAKPEPTPEPSDDDARPLTGEPVVPMRLRAEPPRVTRLSRKVLAGLGLVSSLSIGGALIYALQTRDGGGGNTELHSNRESRDRRWSRRPAQGLYRSCPRPGFARRSRSGRSSMRRTVASPCPGRVSAHQPRHRRASAPRNNAGYRRSKRRGPGGSLHRRRRGIPDSQPPRPPMPQRPCRT